jgi:hypothetical protein
VIPRIFTALLIAGALELFCGFTVHASGRQYTISKVSQARPEVVIKCQPPTGVRKKKRGMRGSEKTKAHPTDRNFIARADRNFVARARALPLQRDHQPVAPQSDSRGWSLVRAARTLPPRLSDSATAAQTNLTAAVSALKTAAHSVIPSLRKTKSLTALR